MTGHGSLILGIIGVWANCIIIATLTRNKELSSYFFNWLLTTLTILDSMFLACGAYDAIKNQFLTSSYLVLDQLHVSFIHPFRSMLMVSSIYMMIALSYERYKAVSGTTTYQGNINDILHPWQQLFKYVSPVIIGSIIFYIPKFWEFEMIYSPVIEDSNLTSNQTIKNSSSVTNITLVWEMAFSSLRHNKIYVLWYVTVLNTLMTSVVPFLALVYLNIKIYLGLQRIFQRRRTLRNRASGRDPQTVLYHERHERVKRNESQTTVLLLIVCVFLLCHSLRLVLNIAEIVNHENERRATEKRCFGVQYWMLVGAVFSNFLVYVNSSANLFVYCIANEHLRGILMASFRVMLDHLKHIFCWYSIECDMVKSKSKCISCQECLCILCLHKIGYLNLYFYRANIALSLLSRIYALKNLYCKFVHILYNYQNANTRRFL